MIYSSSKNQSNPSEPMQTLHIQIIPWQGVPKLLLKKHPLLPASGPLSSSLFSTQGQADCLAYQEPQDKEPEDKELLFSLGSILLSAITNTLPKAEHETSFGPVIKALIKDLEEAINGHFHNRKYISLNNSHPAMLKSKVASQLLGQSNHLALI